MLASYARAIPPWTSLRRSEFILSLERKEGVLVKQMIGQSANVGELPYFPAIGKPSQPKLQRQNHDMRSVGHLTQGHSQSREL